MLLKHLGVATSTVSALVTPCQTVRPRVGRHHDVALAMHSPLAVSCATNTVSAVVRPNQLINSRSIANLFLSSRKSQSHLSRLQHRSTLLGIRLLNTVEEVLPAVEKLLRSERLVRGGHVGKGVDEV